VAAWNWISQHSVLRTMERVTLTEQEKANWKSRIRFSRLTTLTLRFSEKYCEERNFFFRVHTSWSVRGGRDCSWIWLLKSRCMPRTYRRVILCRFMTVIDSLCHY
jgi:hypothetical protein